MNALRVMRPLVLALCLLAGFSSGCKSERRESADCLKARQAALEATISGTLAEAERLYAQTQALCGAASAYHLERLERALERKRKHEQTPTQTPRLGGPLRDFVAFARGFREASDKSDASTRCAERPDPRFGLCTTRKSRPANIEYVIDYFHDDPQVFRFQLVLDSPATCVDFGEHRDLASWREAQVSFERCDLSGSGLSGLRGLIEATPGRTIVSLFSANYPKVDREFAAKLQP